MAEVFGMMGWVEYSLLGLMAVCYTIVAIGIIMGVNEWMDRHGS